MTRYTLRTTVVAVLLLLGSVATQAGGPLLVRAPGEPFRWPGGGVNIPFNPDLGGLGPMNNADAVAQTTAAFDAWEAIPSASATHVNAGALPVDVDETNFAPYLNATTPDGLSAIVYDEDGAIFTLLFGAGSGVLGFASPEWINLTTGDIVEGYSFMNGGSLLGPGAFPVAEFLSVQVHEFGHYQNMAHTVINGQAAGFGDHTGPSPFNTFPPVPFAGRIETMYPFLFVNGGQATPHADDIAMYSTLYPEAGFEASTGRISGRILAPNGTTPVTGVNVIARNVANPFDDAVSAISSDFTDDFTSGAPFVGEYTLRGLTPGADYAIFVDRITNGGFSTPPRNPLPGPEELYNGALESNDPTTDIPSVFTPVAAAAGATVEDVDIVFNSLPAGPLPIGDDQSIEIFTDFPIKFCGTSYDSVFVNSNGNLTFGAGSTAFGESVAGILTGPPMLAGLWDDLNPAAGGTVTVEQTAHSLTVNFTDVPEFALGGANSFSFKLRRSSSHHRDDEGEAERGGRGRDGGRFKLDYGDLSATDGAAGFSCGGRVTSGFEKETDLSRRSFIDGRDETAVFEVFTAADNDLSGERFEGVTPKTFEDAFEPNDDPTPRPAHGGHHDDGLISLPFDTAKRYSEIHPGDVDFFRFEGKAGDIIAIETVPGLQSLDTVVGILNSTGVVLLADDDSGVGLLSRLLVQILVDGEYQVGVSTFPDLGFTGAGGDFGRYILSVRKYRGTIIPVGDDSSVEVPLTTFQFPFQGTQWSSVFVNGNGNLTFGAANGDFTETVPELLSGPARIAPLWDDLNPVNGLVIVEERHRKLSVHFVSVPEFLATGTNYFSLELDSRGEVSIDYGATNRSDGIVGVTEGGGAVDPGPTDLSRAHRLRVHGTTYEVFAGSFGTYGGVDLSFDELEFEKKKH